MQFLISSLPLWHRAWKERLERYEESLPTFPEVIKDLVDLAFTQRVLGFILPKSTAVFTVYE